MMGQEQTPSVTIERWDNSNSHKEERYCEIARHMLGHLGKSITIVAQSKTPVMMFPPRKNGGITVYLWASPNTEKFLLEGSASQLWGLSTYRNTNCYSPSGEGRVVRDDKTSVVGEVIGDNFYLFYAPQTFENQFAGEEVFRRFLWEALHPEATEDERAEYPKIAELSRLSLLRFVYIRRCVERMQMDIANSDRAVRGGDLEIADLQIKLVQKIREVNVIRSKLDGLIASASTEKVRLGGEFDKLCRLPKVQKVDIVDGRLKIFTDILYCVDPRSGLRHEIGAFRIEISLGNVCSIRWYNLTRIVSGHSPAMHAPHIFTEGQACLGNAAEIFANLIGNYDFCMAVSMAIKFVETVNVDDPAGRCIDRWPVAPDNTKEKKEDARDVPTASV